MHCLSQLVVTSILFCPGAQDLKTPDTHGSRVTARAPCTALVRDRATGNCVIASSVGTLGALFPLSVDFNVTPAGDVGIGTSTPRTKLEVAGTLTLDPHDDHALDIKAGSFYKDGILFIHDKGGFANSALGLHALANITTGSHNTATGYGVLQINTTGFANTATGSGTLFQNTSGPRNTATGYRALTFNTTGGFNTANGESSLVYNTTGGYNTATGSGALYSNRTGNSNTASGLAALANNVTGNFNTASGHLALLYNYTGSNNIALGSNAGRSIRLSNNIAIGNMGTTADAGTIRIGDGAVHTKAFFAGIRGVATGNANTMSVLIDSAGQLGTVSSSRRFKEDIRDMDEATERLLDLRPVLFRYKDAFSDGEKPIQYGLIAEDVAEVFPELVVYDEEGKPFTVKYHLLSSMLLNELQKQDQELARQRDRAESQAGELDELRAMMGELQERLKTVESVTVASVPRAVVPSDSR